LEFEVGRVHNKQFPYRAWGTTPGRGFIDTCCSIIFTHRLKKRARGRVFTVSGRASWPFRLVVTFRTVGLRHRRSIEIDVATFEHDQAKEAQAAESLEQRQQIAIPEPTKTIVFSFATDIVEVQIFREFGELTLVGAVELVSPANKDRPENRDAFVSKCDAILRQAVGLVLVDVVTSRNANLHSSLMERFGESSDDDNHLYMASYRPFPGESGPALSIWYRALQVGGEIPSMLLFLKEGPIVELPLAETYHETCHDLKVPDELKPL